MTDPNKAFLRELLATFQAEADEHLREIVSAIVLLEQAEADAQPELVDRILKKLHTLKGAARAVNLSELETLCHAMEDAFSALHAAGRTLAPDQFDLMHQAASLARELAGGASGRLRNQAVALTARLRRLAGELAAGTGDGPAAVVQEPAAADAPRAAEDAPDTAEESGGEAPAAKNDVIRVQGRNLDTIRYQAEALLPVELGLQHHIADLLKLADEMTEHRDRARPATAGVRRRGALRPARTAAENQARSEAKRRGTDADSDSGGFELRCRRLAAALGRTQREFALLRSRLMDATLEAALVPFASALEQLPVLVRNLARSRGKEAVLGVRGESVRVDRRILDSVREALIHLVTNAVDHGIEPAEKRLAAGKPAAGSVRIAVELRGDNQVAVTVSDDGAGIDIAAVASAAARHGHRSADELAALDDRQKLNLVLENGISTRAQVTQVSGRGVGMAIVADKVAAVGGELSIENFPGAGCSFTLLLPVRLATLRGLVLRAGDSRYVAPLAGIDTVRALKDGDLQTVEGRETLLAGGRVLPVVRLRRLLRVAHVDSAQSVDEGIAVIAHAGTTAFALLVHEILAEQEVLPKSLGKQLRRVRHIAGAAQLGDGTLAPILALEDIARHGLAAGAGTAAVAARDAGAAPAAKRVLVVEDSITSRLLLKHILEGAGYRVDTAVDGLDALSRLRQDDYDAVVSDVEMPQLDGLALTERIRANPKTEEMPVILVTSLQTQEERERGLRAGADAYVVKGSFDQDNLLTTIRRLI